MLPDKITRLLAAYIDGELSARHRRTVRRMLKKSSEARQLYRRLKSDAHGLRTLPAVSAPADLSASILEEISRLELPQATPAAAAQTQSALPALVNLALAASVLAAVTVGSYFFFAGFPFSGQDEPMAKKIERDKARLKFSIAQLGKDDSHRALLQQFKKESAVRLDVRTQNPALTVQRLSAILGANDIRTLIEPEADKDLRTGKKGKRYVLFLENVLPYELSTMLQVLGKEEKERPSRVSDVALYSLTAANRSQVAALLGESVEKLQPAARIKAGKKARWPGPHLLPNGNKGEGKANHEPSQFRQRIALILPLDMNSASSHAETDEVKQFVAARRVRAPHPNTLQVMVVLHEVTV